MVRILERKTNRSLAVSPSGEALLAPHLGAAEAREERRAAFRRGRVLASAGPLHLGASGGSLGGYALQARRAQLVRRNELLLRTCGRRCYMMLLRAAAACNGDPRPVV